jgi:3-oxoacyl-[acyl-carrier protein] reductase
VAAASAGLGYAAAKALVEEGAMVAICGRRLDRVNAAADSIGPGCIPLVHDVSRPEGGAEFVRAAAQVLGGVDVLVANGGGPPVGNYAETEFERYLPAIEQSLLSVVAMCQAATPGMQSRGWGRVVAITSLAARQPMAELILSNTARAGVTGFLKTVARELAGHGITVNSVQPGLHATDRVTSMYGDRVDEVAKTIPAGRIGSADDFGSIVAFLCSDQAKFVTGVQLHIDGGAYAALL